MTDVRPVRARGSPPAHEGTGAFAGVAADLTAERLSGRDPLARFLLRLSPGSVRPIFLAALLINGTLIVGAGFVIGAIYGCGPAPARFVCISDPRVLIPDILGNIISFSIIWAFYAWQPRGLAGAVRQVGRNGVIVRRRPDGPAEITPSISAPFAQVRWSLLAFGFTLIGLALWYRAVTGPTDPFRLGGTTQWFLVNRWYFWIIYVPLIFVNLYMLAWMIIRHVLFARALDRVFRTFDINPKLHHADGCNGLAPVGDVAMYNGLIVVLIGFWVAFFMAYPRLLGQPVNIGPDTIAMLIVYLAAVPALVLSGTWSAHKAMMEAKHRDLEVLSEQLRVLLAETDPDHIRGSVGLLEELERRYQIKRRDYRDWPLRPQGLIRLGLTSLGSPFVSWVIPLSVERYVLPP